MHVLQDINREILTLCAVEEIEREIEDSEAVDAKILKYKRKMEEALRSLASSSRSETAETGELAAPLSAGGASQAGRSPGKNGTYRESIQRRLIITSIHSCYIVTISMIVVSIVYFRLIASSYWIPTLARQGNVL